MTAGDVVRLQYVVKSGGLCPGNLQQLQSETRHGNIGVTLLI